MTKPAWEDRDYRTIASVSFDGRLHVGFANGDQAVVDIDRLLPETRQDLVWDEARPNAQELVVPSADGTLEIAWSDLRALTDPKFARFLVDTADEEAQRVGRGIRALRERRGMTSKEVAEAAGIAPMSLSRIELGRHDVVFRTLRRILAAMHYSLLDLAEVSGPQADAQGLLKRLRAAGVDAAVITALRRAVGDEVERLTGAAERIFGWTAPELLSEGPLEIAPAAAATGRFKSQINQDPRLSTYTLWARWLALLVDQAAPRDPVDLPENPYVIREDVIESCGSMRFEDLLDWCWRNGVAVLPMADPGHFHGACWTIEGRAVVVLKQRTEWTSRWLFDLAHELGHIARHLDEKNTAVVELSEVTPLPPDDDDDEQEASDFAGELLLGDADALAQELASRTEGKLPRLKAEVVKLARERGVEVDALANYMAYRLDREGEQWWPTAAKLQDTSGSAQALAREALLARLDWSRLAEDDAALLRIALDWSDDGD
jgi:transcriptional regulator with XRE-family HTH domain/Zn-dependent peptidase ImmA (M78 family)